MAKKIKHVDFTKFYDTPEWYKPPANTQLNACYDYPNLNSINYRNQMPNNDLHEHFYEILETNENQTTFILAANTYTGRVWDGSLYLYNRDVDIGSIEKCPLRSKLNTTISNIRFIDDKLFLLSDYNGSIQMWSTQSAMRSETGYNLFNIASKTDSLSVINSIDILSGENENKKVITASADCSIRIYNIGSVDLISERVYKFAHSDVVEDISSHPTDDSLFSSCSSDKSFSIWDIRMAKPVIGYHENHIVGYKSCKWITADHIYIGDESGTIYVYDVKNFATPIQTLNVFNRPIYRLKSNENNLCVIGQSNHFKIFDTSNNQLNMIYDDENADDFVRDICWIKKNKKLTKQFYTIGYNKHVKRHEMK